MNYTESQLQAINHVNGNCCVYASSGSGKTKVLVERIKNLITTHNIPQHNILAITFSKKATENMRDRLGSDYSDVNVSTFHALGYKMLKEQNYFPRWYQPISPWELKKAIEDIVLGMAIEKDRNKVDIKGVVSYISAQKSKLIRYTDKQVKMKQMPYDFKSMCSIYKEYEKFKTSKGKIDFDDMILHMYYLLKDNHKARGMYQGMYKYISCDENQDLNVAQYEILRLLAKTNNNLFVVGDPLQCWSADNKVKTLNGIKKIKNLKIGDMVETIKRQSIAFSEITNISKSKAKTVEITTSSGNKLEVTYDHRCFATQPIFQGKYRYVYLMYREDKGYRVGIAKGGNSESLRCRTVCEGADKMWLIKQFDNANDASLFENYISLKYQVPTNPFMYNGRGLNLTQNGLNDLFKEFGKNGETILEDYNLLFDYPNYSKEIQSATKKRINILMNNKRDGNHVYCESQGERVRRYFLNYKDAYNFAHVLKNELTNVVSVKEKFSMGNKLILDVITASQLMIGMQIPITKNGKIEMDEIVEINKKDTEEDVFDIEVAETGNLIANGIVSHNCIYAFRGCENKHFIDFPKDWVDTKVINLGLNFRSSDNIVKMANKLVEGMVETTHDNYIESVAFNPKFKQPTYTVYDNDEKEAIAIAKKIQSMIADRNNNYQLKDFTVLVRTNFQLQAIENAFFDAELEYCGVGIKSFYDRKEIKSLIYYLRLINDTNHNEAFESICNVPNRFLGKVFIDEVSSYAMLKDVSMFESMLKFPRSNEWRYKNGINQIVSIVAKAMNLKINNVAEVVAFIRKETDYDTFISRDIGEDDENDKLDNINKFESYCAGFETVKELLDKIDGINSFTANAENNQNKVNLMTAHKSKGMEYGVVFIPSVNQGIMPHSKSDNIDEEKRLFYVAITRAEKEVFISSSRYGNRKAYEPSEFLYSIFDDVDDKFDS